MALTVGIRPNIKKLCSVATSEHLKVRATAIIVEVNTFIVCTVIAIYTNMTKYVRTSNAVRVNLYCWAKRAARNQL